MKKERFSVPFGCFLAVLYLLGVQPSRAFVIKRGIANNSVLLRQNGAVSRNNGFSQRHMSEENEGVCDPAPAIILGGQDAQIEPIDLTMQNREDEFMAMGGPMNLPPAVLSSLADDQDRQLRSTLPPAVQMSLEDASERERRPTGDSSLGGAQQRGPPQVELPPDVFSTLTDSISPESLPPAVLASLAQDVEVETTVSDFQPNSNVDQGDDVYDDEVFNAHFVNRGPSSEAPPIFTQHEISMETTDGDTPKGEVKLFTGFFQGNSAGSEAIEEGKTEEKVEFKQVKTDMGFKVVPVSEEDKKDTADEGKENTVVHHKSVKTAGGFQLVTDTEDPTEDEKPSAPKPKKYKSIKLVTGGEEWIEEPPPKMKKVPTFSGGYEIVEDKAGPNSDLEKVSDQKDRKIKIKQIKTAAGYHMVEVNADDDSVNPSSDPKAAGIGQMPMPATNPKSENQTLSQVEQRDLANNLSGDKSIGIPSFSGGDESVSSKNLQKVQTFSGGFEFVEESTITEVTKDAVDKPENLKFKQVKTSRGYDVVEVYEDEDDDTSSALEGTPEESMDAAPTIDMLAGDDSLSAEDELLRQAALGESQVTEPPSLAKKRRYKKVQNFSGGFELIEDSPDNDTTTKEKETISGVKAPGGALNGAALESFASREKPSKSDNADSPEPQSSTSVDVKYQAHQGFTQLDEDHAYETDVSPEPEPKKYVKVQNFSGGFEFIEDTGENSEPDAPGVESTNSEEKPSLLKIETATGYKIVDDKQDQEEEPYDVLVPPESLHYSNSAAENEAKPSFAGMKLKVDQESPLPEVGHSIPTSGVPDASKDSEVALDTPKVDSIESLGKRASQGFSVPLGVPVEATKPKAPLSDAKDKRRTTIPAPTGGFEIIHGEAEKREEIQPSTMESSVKKPVIEAAAFSDVSSTGRVDDDEGTKDAKKVKVRQVQTPAGYQMVEYVDTDEHTEGPADRIAKFGIRRAEYAETWMKRRQDIPSNAKNEASIGTSVTIKAPPGQNEGSSPAKGRAAMAKNAGKEAPSKKKPRVKQVKTAAGYQMVEYYGDDDEDSTISKFGIRRADYAETWMTAKSKNASIASNSVKDKALEGTSVPIQAPSGVERDVAASGDAVDEDQSVELPTKTERRIRVKQVQTDAGYQMVEYYDDDDEDNTISKFGIRRADYAETWMDKKRSDKSISSISVKDKALEGTSVPIQAPSPDRQSATAPEQVPPPDQAKRLDEQAIKGTSVPIRVPQKAMDEEFEDLGLEDSIKETVPDSEEQSSEDDRNGNQAFRQVSTPAGYRMVKGDIGSSESGSASFSKYNVRRADYVDTWRKTETTTSTERDIPLPDQTKRVDEHAMQGTSVPIKAPLNQTDPKAGNLPPPDQSKRVDESAMAGTFVPIKAYQKESTMEKRQLPPPDQTKRLDVQALDGTAVHVRASIDGKASAKKTKVKQVKTPAGYQMVPYSEDDDEEDGIQSVSKFGIRRVDYIDTWRTNKKSLEEVKAQKEEAPPADQTRSIHQQAMEGTFVAVEASSEESAFFESARASSGSLQSDQGREVGNDAMRGTQGFIDSSKISSNSTTATAAHIKPDQERRVDEKAVEGTAGVVNTPMVSGGDKSIDPQANGSKTPKGQPNGLDVPSMNALQEDSTLPADDGLGEIEEESDGSKV